MDRAEFTEFVAQAGPGLSSFATSIAGGDYHDGRDLAQAALERLATRFTRLDAAQAPDVYVRRCIVRLHLNEQRRLSRQRSLGKRWLGHARHEAPADRSVSDTDLSPWLREAWQGLPVRQRTAIALVHVWGYSAAEAGGLMDCAENTIRTHLQRGLSSLRGAAPAQLHSNSEAVRGE